MTDQEHKQKNYLDTGLHKIHKVLLFCQNQYDCRNQIISHYYLWNDDNDICHLLEIIEEMISINFKIIEDDVVEVFCKSNTKKNRKSGLAELEELASYMLTDLVIRNYIQQKTSLYYSLPNAQTLSANTFIMELVAKVK
ncbi:10902_t:CDS:2, partial [Funneliformis geosporum]